MQQNFREYLATLHDQGYTVRDDQGSDPDLIDPLGNPVETWREDYPYDERLDREQYDIEKYLLQVELLKFQKWTRPILMARRTHPLDDAVERLPRGRSAALRGRE